MATIRPFRGLRYSATAGPLADQVAPPYDVLSSDERDALATRSSHNVVHLTLPEQLPDDRSKFVKYARSASRLEQWRHDGSLVVEARPSFYRYRQTFSVPGSPDRLERLALIATIKVEPYEKGVVLPHEQTFPKHKEDRLRILEATRSHLECIYGLFEDDDRASYSQTYATVHATAHDTAITTAITDDTDERPAHATTDTRSLQFSLSYPTMFIAAAAFLMLLTVAFLAGRKGAPRLALTGPTLEQLQQSKPSPEVMNLKNTRAETTLSGGEVKSAKSAEVAPRNEPVRQQPAAQPLTPDRRRIVGRNYIIAQSYPDPDNAEKAAALMQKNNIPVSVEQLDAAPGWYCVVTQVGFDRVSSPDCERYQKLIKDLSPQARSAKLKSFDEPYLYKWK